MKRLLLLIAAVVTAAGLAAAPAAAQSLHWTGHYYIAAGDAAGSPVSLVGHHRGWNAPEPITAFEGGAIVDLALRPADAPASSLVPDHRYDLLAVGVQRDVAIAAEGFENEGAPYFGAGVPIPDVGRPHAVAAGRDDYLVVATRSTQGPILTGDYVVAVGSTAKWSVVPGPDFRGGVFVDLAVALRPTVDDAVDPIVAVGHLAGQAVVVSGFLVDGVPTFEFDYEVLPSISRPISVQWTGLYFAVMGMDDAGRLVVIYGMPGAWNDSKSWVTNGMVPTHLAVAPTRAQGLRAKAFDLLAIGTLKGRVVTLTGEDAGGFPVLYDDWAEVPGLGAPSAVSPAAAFATAPAATAITAPTPNPFSATSRVTITVGREQPVLVEVFDAIGRRVAMLHNGVLAAGVGHEFALDAGSLPQGTYHFRISGVDFDEVRTVTLAR